MSAIDHDDRARFAVVHLGPRSVAVVSLQSSSHNNATGRWVGSWHIVKRFAWDDRRDAYQYAATLDTEQDRADALAARLRS